MKKFFTVLSIIIILFFLIPYGIRYKNALESTPKELKIWFVREIEYDSYKDPFSIKIWSGLYAYYIPKNVAERILIAGKDFFWGKGIMGSSGEWHETPIKEERFWIKEGHLDCGNFKPGIQNYTNWCFGIPEKYQKEINSSLSKKGSFYSHAFGGIFVVNPKTQKAYFVW